MDIETEAEIIRRGLEAGYLSLRHAGRWADRVVMHLSQPPLAIINLSLMQYANTQDAAAELATFVPAVPADSLLPETIASMHEALEADDQCAEAIAENLFARALEGQFAGPLDIPELFVVRSEFSDVVMGYGSTREDAVHFLRTTLEQLLRRVRTAA